MTASVSIRRRQRDAEPTFATAARRHGATCRRRDMTTANWDLPEDMVMLQETARRFMRQEVKPAEDKLPHDATALPAEVLKPLQAKARALGLWQVESPAEMGGGRVRL